MTEPDLLDEESLDEDEKLRMCQLCEEVVDTLDDFDAETDEALKALTSVIAAIICNHISTKQLATKTLDTVCLALLSTVQMAEDRGQTEWIRNRAN